MTSLVLGFIASALTSLVATSGESIPLAEVCIARMLPTYDKAIAGKLASISTPLMVGSQFGLFSHLHSVQPIAGSPIRFMPNGDVESTTFPEARWSIWNETLILEEKQKQTMFKYHKDCGVLAAPMQVGGNVLLLELSIVATPTKKDHRD